MSDLRNQLISDIQKTGFPTELTVESILNRRNWQVSTHEYFIDHETGKGREIDCSGRFILRSDQDSTYINVVIRIYIEAKKSEKPWVVFTSPKSQIEKWLTGQLIATQKAGPYAARKPFEKSLPTHSFERYGRAVHIAFKADNATAFSAIVSASKAALEGHKNVETEEGFTSNDSTDVIFYLPIVVLDGELWDCHHDTTGDLSLEKSKFIPFRFNYKSPEYSDQYSCHLDIVSVEHFDEYIGHLETAVKSVFTNLTAQARIASSK